MVLAFKNGFTNLDQCQLVAPDTRSVRLSAEQVASMGGRESIQTKQYVNSLLGLHRLNRRGTVHLWQYHDNSVRYTFHPAERPSAAFALAC